MHLLKNLRRKYDNVLYIVDYIKWLYELRDKPLSIGTTIEKKEGNHIVYYQVVGHENDARATEILEEIRREKLK